MLNTSIVLFQEELTVIKKLVTEIKKYSENNINKIFLIDNSGNPEKYRELSLIEGVEYLRSSGNIGYGSGHNIALRKSLEDKKNRYHAVINPDIQIENEVFKSLTDFMNANSDIGLAMPKVIYHDGSFQYLCKLLPTPIDLIFRRFFNFSFLKKFVMRINNRYEMRFADYSHPLDVPVISGCFMFLRTEVLRQVGLFDEKYFMYVEDVDLSRRIGQKSRVVYFPGVFVKHGFQKGSYKSIKLLFYHVRSAIYYFNKWGWFFDSYRKKKNREIMEMLQNDRA